MEFKELIIEWWVDQRRNKEKNKKIIDLKENENTSQSSVTHWSASKDEIHSSKCPY